MSNPLVPDPDWSKLGREFTEAQEAAVQQKILCARCVRDGNIEPPAAVVIYKGESCCGTHYPVVVWENT